MNNDLAWAALAVTAPTVTVALVGQQTELFGWPAVGLAATLAFTLWFLFWAASGGLCGLRPARRGQR